MILVNVSSIEGEHQSNLPNIEIEPEEIKRVISYSYTRKFIVDTEDSVYICEKITNTQIKPKRKQ